MKNGDALREALDLVYGLRNFAHHHADCRFVRTMTGVETENQPCSCRFDEVETAYERVTHMLLAALRDAP